jgi:hypothetical protein
VLAIVDCVTTLGNLVFAATKARQVARDLGMKFGFLERALFGSRAHRLRSSVSGGEPFQRSLLRSNVRWA